MERLSRSRAHKKRPSKRTRKAQHAVKCKFAKQCAAETRPNLCQLRPGVINLPDCQAGPSAVHEPQEMSSPSLSTSTKKLKMFETTSAGEIVQALPSDYLLVHKNVWGELLKNLKCYECDNNALELQMRENKGFATKLVVKCTACGTNCGETFSSPQTKSDSKRPPFEVNKKMVEAFVSTGSGHSAMQTFCSVVGMKGMALGTYQSHLDKIAKETDCYNQKILSRSRRAVREAHEVCDPTLKSSNVMDIAVSYDGTWHKRGHTSLYGVGLVIDILTGLVIDYEVLSKFCHACSFAAADLGENSPEYKFWLDGHEKSGDCNKNYTGSSNAMETVAAERLWLRSEKECGMRYTTVLSDGDAKTHLHLKTLAVYGAGVEINKEECINHVAKRMGTGLRKLVKESKSENVKLGGRGVGKLNEKAISALTNYYRAAIVNGMPDVRAMRRGFVATLSHSVSTDEKPRHDKCPTGLDSWCFYNRSKAKGEEPQSHKNMKLQLSEATLKAIAPLCARLTSTELLSKCTRGATQNANESVHSLIWRKCPKGTFVSKIKINIAVANAVAEFNMGCLQSQLVKITIGEGKLTEVAKNILTRRDRKRTQLSELKRAEKQKRARLTRKLKKSTQEKKAKKREGQTYGAGLF
ncbi:uncharacterized protein [Periplaneta americana]|uniref:uncharacterized protein n=1 Tax=Periplaneta americana TaxID=6978 RepID=UPI0037E93940